MTVFETRPYYDSDIREQPDLIDIATDWVWDYTGDFEFLVRVQDELHRTGKLPFGTARAILNCMRRDPVAYNLLPKRRTPLRIVPPPREQTKKRSLHLRMAGKVKVPYGVARFNGSVIHLVLPNCSIEWEFPQKTFIWPYEYDKTKPRIPAVLFVGWFCGRYHSGTPLLFNQDTVPNYRFCKKCLETFQERTGKDFFESLSIT